MQDLYARQQLVTSLRNIQNIKHVNIIGCGGIGSHVAIRLAMLGIKSFTLADYDTVEFHNLSRTFFEDGDVGKNKAMALQDILRRKRTFNSNTILKDLMEKRSFEVKNLLDAKAFLENEDIETILNVADSIEDNNITVRCVTKELEDEIHPNATGFKKENVLTVDCTDNYFSEEIIMTTPGLAETDWKLNYDNLDITITSNPYAKDEDGNFKLDLATLAAPEGGYTVTPSFFATPDIVTSLWVTFLSMYSHKIEETNQWHINLLELLEHSFGNEYLIKY